MNPNTRACIAYIAASIASSNYSSSVYDYEQSKHINISGNADGNNVNIYDHDRGCHITGSPSNLYDYGNNAHIQLQITGNSITGYDYASNNHYSGTVNGNSVSIYDHETSSHYNYRI